MRIEPSHAIINVADTDATLAFYATMFGSQVESDHTFAQPALDVLYGVEGVTIRSVFFDAGGYRLHTVETVRPKLAPPAKAAPAPGAREPGINGLSFKVDDVEELARHADEHGLPHDEIVVFTMNREEEMALFFMTDPDGVRLEFCQLRPRAKKR